MQAYLNTCGVWETQLLRSPHSAPTTATTACTRLENTNLVRPVDNRPKNQRICTITRSHLRAEVLAFGPSWSPPVPTLSWSVSAMPSAALAVFVVFAVVVRFQERCPLKARPTGCQSVFYRRATVSLPVRLTDGAVGPLTPR